MCTAFLGTNMQIVSLEKNTPPIFNMFCNAQIKNRGFQLRPLFSIRQHRGKRTSNPFCDKHLGCTGQCEREMED